MGTRRCLFCNKIVPVEVKGNYEEFAGCCCAPDSFYRLARGSYDSFSSLSLNDQRELFPIVTGYIRDLTESGEEVTLSYDDLDTIRNSARIPMTIDEKESLLLRYFYMRCRAPHESVQIQPLSEHINLTYSRNLQEFVYVIEQLRDKKWLERTGTTFELTKDGWEEAAARNGKRKLDPCLVLLPDNSLQDKCRDWFPPILEKYGYFARFAEIGKLEESIPLISECKLLIVDLTGEPPDGYFAAGFALGLGIQVICTMQYTDGESRPPLMNHLKPIVWRETEELAAALRNKLSSNTPLTTN